MPRRLQVFKFTTDHFAPHERHEAWAMRHWPSYASATVAEPLGDFSAYTEEVALGGSTIFYGNYSAQTLNRTRRLINTDGFDHMGLCINLDGRMGGDGYDVPKGGMLLTDLSCDLLHHSEQSRVITIALPRALLDSAGIDTRANHLRTFDATQAALLRSYLVQLRRTASQFAESDGPIILHSIISILAVIIRLSEHGVAAPSVAAQSDSALRIHDLIERNIGDSDLTAAFLSRQLGVSRSTIYRLFEETGGIQAHIRNRRLDLARSALLDAAVNESIGDIAERLGFSDQAYFSRLFRQRFDLTPSMMRSLERRGEY